MDMNPACTPPTQPAVSATERAHPRYAEYEQYRAAMSRQMVTGATFARWLAETEEFEQGRVTIFEVTRNDAALLPGWYKNKFAPKKLMPTTYGPFATKAEAESAK